LRDFERDELLDKRPGEVLPTMMPSMLAEMHTPAPRLWLKRIGAPHYARKYRATPAQPRR
jgi:hypothetical protein